MRVMRTITKHLRSARHAGAQANVRRRHMHAQLALLRTVGGWALYDAYDRAVYEVEGPDARRDCLERAVQLGVAALREGEEMCHHRDKPSAAHVQSPPPRDSTLAGARLSTLGM
jgi:hypothetical protein